MQICIESILWLNVINHFKVKFLCITKYHHDMHHAMKTYKRVEIQLLTFLTWAWGEGVWSASHPGCFTFRERAVASIRYESGWTSQPVWSHWQREKKKVPSLPLLVIKPIIQPVAKSLTDWATLTSDNLKIFQTFKYLETTVTDRNEVHVGIRQKCMQNFSGEASFESHN
jgi:hypothetical protein